MTALILPGLLHHRASPAAVILPVRAHALRLPKLSPPPHAAPCRVAQLDVTAYCAHCEVCDTGDRTASGRAADLPGVAVAEAPEDRALPLGARVFIPQLGWLLVDDTGGGVGPGQLDVRLPSHTAATHWGRQRLHVRWRPAGSRWQGSS